MESPKDIVIRGTCACGRRFRIRNAVAGAAVTCPECGRPIIIHDADLRLAAAGERVVPRQPEDDGPREGRPVDVVDLRLARQGSRPGLSGGATHQQDDALLAGALSGRPAAALPARDGPQATAARRAARGFLGDMIASFYFAGSRGNALNVLATATACSLCTLLLYLPLPLGPVRVVAIIPLILLGLYVIQFYWSVLRETANGEDEIPWFAADWDLWEDAGKPFFWVAAITTLCVLPAQLTALLAPASLPYREAVIWGALLAGTLLWPVGVMSVAIGNTILFARPDWLVRCMLGIGPVYIVAWALVMAVIAGWWALLQFAGQMLLAPMLGVFANLYLGYVLFRMLGLIYYHFRTRFPWRFED
ncbi:MAG: hypothetical protein LC135_13025 [Phycisphaerae bacterium]|nr:hypothetical protein [Phycisphaerae bacterium]MCZ2400775.1 hypothetical protein [Phycisphaerae bacterium]